MNSLGVSLAAAKNKIRGHEEDLKQAQAAIYGVFDKLSLERDLVQQLNLINKTIEIISADKCAASEIFLRRVEIKKALNQSGFRNLVIK